MQKSNEETINQYKPSRNVTDFDQPVTAGRPSTFSEIVDQRLRSLEYEKERTQIEIMGASDTLLHHAKKIMDPSEVYTLEKLLVDLAVAAKK